MHKPCLCEGVAGRAPQKVRHGGPRAFKSEHCSKFLKGEDPRTFGEQRHQCCSLRVCGPASMKFRKEVLGGAGGQFLLPWRAGGDGQHRLWAPARQQGRPTFFFKETSFKLLSRPPGCCCFLRFAVGSDGRLPSVVLMTASLFRTCLLAPRSRLRESKAE